eukprot:1521443-Ditylum_brightwellii.AAC.1
MENKYSLIFYPNTLNKSHHMSNGLSRHYLIATPENCGAKHLSTSFAQTLAYSMNSLAHGLPQEDRIHYVTVKRQHFTSTKKENGPNMRYYLQPVDV